MAGVKGRSGGARPGAGRPKKEVEPIEVPSKAGDPQAFLEALMDDVNADPRMRLEAAKALMPFKYAKLGEGGKKDVKQDAAKKAAAGKFAASAAPLKLVAGK